VGSLLRTPALKEVRARHAAGGMSAAELRATEDREIRSLIASQEAVGRERVIAGTDCGFGTFAGFGPVHPSVCWLKLRSLTEGAALASQKLWGARLSAN
jgi:methionine synthase II (cobalamin-independent)